jgi:hypothetical protein
MVNMLLRDECEGVEEDEKSSGGSAEASTRMDGRTARSAVPQGGNRGVPKGGDSPAYGGA